MVAVAAARHGRLTQLGAGQLKKMAPLVAAMIRLPVLAAT